MVKYLLKIIIVLYADGDLRLLIYMPIRIGSTIYVTYNVAETMYTKEVTLKSGYLLYRWYNANTVFT